MMSKEIKQRWKIFKSIKDLKHRSLSEGEGDGR